MKCTISSYGVLVLPETKVIPIETMRAIHKFSEVGGTVIALGELPSEAAGLRDCDERDQMVKKLVGEIFEGDQATGILVSNYKMVTVAGNRLAGFRVDGACCVAIGAVT